MRTEAQANEFYGAAYVRPDSWWTKHDLNDELDDSLVHLGAALRAEMHASALPGEAALPPVPRA